MKFPKSVLQSAVDSIIYCIDDLDGECLRYQVCHRSSDGYIENVKLFIRKIAKYLGASVVSISDYEPIILLRGDVYVGIEYGVNADYDLVVRFAVSRDKSFL